MKKYFVDINMCEVDGKNAYFVLNTVPALFEWSLETDESKLLYIGKLSNGATWWSIKKIDNYIYMFSDWGNEITRFDLNSGSVLQKSIDGTATLGIFDVHFISGRIYVLSSRRGLIYEINPLDLKIMSETQVFEVSQPMCRSLKYGNEILVATGQNYLSVFDVNSKVVKNFKLWDSNERLRNIFIHDDKLYVSGDLEGGIYVFTWDDNNFVFDKMIKLIENEKDENFPIVQGVILANNCLYIIPNIVEKIIVYDLKTEKVEDVFLDNVFNEIRTEIIWNPRYRYVYDNEKELCITDKKIGCMYKINKINKDIRSISFGISKKDYVSCFKDLVLEESDLFGLNEFLECLLL